MGGGTLPSISRDSRHPRGNPLGSICSTFHSRAVKPALRQEGGSKLSRLFGKEVLGVPLPSAHASPPGKQRPPPGLAANGSEFRAERGWALPRAPVLRRERLGVRTAVQGKVWPRTQPAPLHSRQHPGLQESSLSTTKYGPKNKGQRWSFSGLRLRVAGTLPAVPEDRSVAS